jgi:hypothetical protein
LRLQRAGVLLAPSRVKHGLGGGGELCEGWLGVSASWLTAYLQTESNQKKVMKTAGVKPMSAAA